MVEKYNLNKLKEADTSAQNSSSTGDTIGNTAIVMRMKNHENDVQAMQESVAALRNTLEGIRALRAAKTISEDVKVGGGND